MSGLPFTVVLAVLAALAGFGAGWLHFASLARVADLIVDGRPSAIGLQLARIAVLGCLLGLFAWAGAAVLLAGTAGVLAGRSFVLRRTR
ncbi:MAG: hypothetical protein QM766_19255 [Burkholderiaceae bacterium]